MRYVSLDMVRGFAVLAMLFVNILTFLSADLPLILQHNLEMMMPGDLVAPLFQFILGISLVISVDRRKARDEKVWKHVLKRAVSLIVLGFILTSSLMGFQEIRWGVLQSLGVGLLLGYLFLPLPVVFRATAAGLVLLSYSLLFVFVPGFSDFIMEGTHGGPVGAISYGMVTVFGTIAGEWLYRKKERLRQGVLVGFGLILLSLIISIVISFNRQTVSASYMLFSAGLSFLLISMFYCIGEWKKKDVKPLSLMGRNALSLWIALYVFYLPFIYILGGCCFMPAYIGLAATILILPLFYVLADILEWKKIRLTI